MEENPKGPPKDFQNMLLKDKLKLFAKGPCSPILIVPSIMGTRLVAKINYKVLKKTNPYLYKKCKFDSYFDIFYKTETGEHIMWIPLLRDKVGMINPACFSRVLSPKFNLQKSHKEWLENVPGI